MNSSRSQARSLYMEFAKLRPSTRYNLATSGMASYPLADLGVSIEQLEINGPDKYGYVPLNEAIARRYGVSSDCVVAAAGTSMANYLAMAACTEAGDEILVEQPTYALLLDTARYLGLEIVRFQRPAKSGYQIDLADLERKLSRRTRLIVLCDLHNPSGAQAPEDTLRKVGEMARSVGARVLVDEVYREMLWEAQPRSAFHLDQQVFISTNSLTKAYGLSGLRCGWVLAEPELCQHIWHINDVHASTAAHPAELLGVIAFQKLAEIAARQRRRLETNRLRLRTVLEEQHLLEPFWPEHGTVVFSRLRIGSAAEFCDWLRREYDLAVVPGGFFEDESRLRIGVGGFENEVAASLEKLAEAVARWSFVR